jgi:hypothetical protein
MPDPLQLPEFACHVHSYLRQFVQAADQKAVFTLAASGAELGFLISHLSDNSYPHSLCFWVIGIPGALLLASAAGLAALSVRPRQNGVKIGLVAWGGILEHGNADSYIKSVREADLFQEVLAHGYTLSVIVRDKYTLLKYAINSFIAGSLVTIVFFAVAIVERRMH